MDTCNQIIRNAYDPFIIKPLIFRTFLWSISSKVGLNIYQITINNKLNGWDCFRVNPVMWWSCWTASVKVTMMFNLNGKIVALEEGLQQQKLALKQKLIKGVCVAFSTRQNNERKILQSGPISQLCSLP